MRGRYEGLLAIGLRDFQIQAAGGGHSWWNFCDTHHMLVTNCGIRIGTALLRGVTFLHFASNGDRRFFLGYRLLSIATLEWRAGTSSEAVRMHRRLLKNPQEGNAQDWRGCAVLSGRIAGSVLCWPLTRPWRLGVRGSRRGGCVRLQPHASTRQIFGHSRYLRGWHSECVREGGGPQTLELEMSALTRDATGTRV